MEAKTLKATGWGGKFTDPTMIFGAILVVVVLMLTIPIPAFMLDFLMSINLLFGIIVVLTVAYTRKTTDLSIFPTLLLFTTILRVAVNVSSTRLILTKGEDFDGKMVRAFGEFVVGGKTNDASSLVVGVIIFAIIVLVQFLVITKGATRVTEVAARFSLDKMPNMFMAIDVEVQNGVITEVEAIQKRKQINEESQFYGNMDGASKFIQGDVTLGIIITLVNIVGGLIIGIAIRGESFDIALNNYISLTIGDGLVGQIPSLLISFATGLLVTRASSEETSIGETFWEQLSRYDRVYMISGAALIVMGVLPGFPTMILLTMGAFLIYFGFMLKKRDVKTQHQQEVMEKEKSESTQKKGPEDVSSLLKVDTLSLHIGYELIPLVNGAGDISILSSIAAIRRKLATELGIIVPPIRIQDNISIGTNQYIFKIRGQDIGMGFVKTGYMMAMGDGLEEIDGEKTQEPAFGLEAYWIKEEQRVEAEGLGYTVVDPPTIISTHLQELLREHAYEILDREATDELLKTVGKEKPVILHDVLEEAKFTKSQIQKILQILLIEGISIRDLPSILETLSDSSAQSPVYELVELIRQSLKRVICNKYKTEDNELHVLRVNPKVENEIYKNMSLEKDGEPVIRLNPDMLNKIQLAIRDQATLMYQNGFAPVIVTQPQIRKAVWEIAQSVNKNIAVLSSRELVSDIDIHLFGQIEVQ